MPGLAHGIIDIMCERQPPCHRECTRMTEKSTAAKKKGWLPKKHGRLQKSTVAKKDINRPTGRIHKKELKEVGKTRCK